MKGFGCLFLLVLLAVIAAEVWLVIVLGGLAEPIGGVLTVILITVVVSVIGFKLFKWWTRQIPQAMISGRIGRAVAGLVGAVLLLIPGLATGLVGLLMQLPPVQALLAGLMHKVFLVFTASAMKKMGGMGGFPGGMPGGMGGFPGAKPGGMAGFPGGAGGGMTPAQMAQLQKMMGAMGQSTAGGPAAGLPKKGKGPKTYDVKPEK